MINIKKQFLENIKNGPNQLSENFGDDLSDLVNWGRDNGYIDGVVYSRYDQGGGKLNVSNSRLTLDGKEYLASLDTPNIQAPIQVEVISDDLY